MSIEALLAESGEPYTRERFEADHERIVARLCEKHGVTEAEIPALIAEHRYVHTAEDPEQEWIEAMAFARAAGWL